MVGSFLTRILVMIFGYAYPAYECFKTVEKNKMEIEQLRFWCQYWILIAMITVFERVGDTFLSWVPMYSEAKVAFFIYLWYPKTKGTTYVYDSFFRPYLAKHETEIDRNLLELRARCADFAVLYWQKAASYGQTRVFDIIQYVSAQSTPRPQPTQQQQGTGTQAPPAVRPNPQPATTTEKSQQPPTRTSSGGRKKQQSDPPPAQAQAQAQAAGTAPALPVPAAAPTPPLAAAAAAAPAPIKEGDQPTMESTSETKQNESEVVDIDISSSYEIVKAPPKETVLEETIRETRFRLRKTRSAAAAAAAAAAANQ